MLVLVRAGRAALQKKIMALLRKVTQPTQGNYQAWEDTFSYWEHATKFLINFPKYKVDEALLIACGAGERSERGDSSAGGLQRTFTKRRALHPASSEHELEVRSLLEILLALLVLV